MPEKIVTEAEYQAMVRKLVNQHRWMWIAMAIVSAASTYMFTKNTWAALAVSSGLCALGLQRIAWHLPRD